MSRDADRHGGAVRPGTRRTGRARSGVRPRAGFVSAFVFIDLLLVLVILGILAAFIIPRSYAPDFSTQARLQTARAAVTEGYARLKLATASYVLDTGDLPEQFSELVPDYMNATEDLGDFTAVYIQGAGQITVEVYRGPAVGPDSGPPAATRSYTWP